MALAGAVTMLAALFAAPATAGAAGSRSLPGGFSSEKRTPVVTGRVNARQAERVGNASPRPATAKRAALSRPARFAGANGTTARPVQGGFRPQIVAGPALVSTHEFAGIDEASAGGGEPPDPWVAVNSSSIVQSTNGLVRISDRNGVEQASIATWAMFNVYPGYVDSDPRIIWDAYHGRWVGVLVWFYPDYSDNYLTVIVSETSDPLGTWDTLVFSYGNYFPDYPAIASSADKVVITANEYVDGADYAWSSFLLAPWASILAGTDVEANYNSSATAWNIRPGRVNGTSADLHFVFESGDTGTLNYLRVTGSTAFPTTYEADLGIANGTGLTLDPRQPGDADGIDLANDGRIPDAVWSGNHLWFSRTVGYAWNSTDLDMAIEVVRLDTTSTTPPTVGMDGILPGSTGVDAFSPGIGASNGGTAFVTYSQSSAAEAPSLVATAIHPTYGLQAPITIENSDASYGGSRWGDFAGIAADPSGADTAWQTHEVSDATGHWRTVVSRLVLDAGAPSASAPNQALVVGTTLGQYKSYAQSVPVRVSWSGSDTGSGVTRYSLAAADHGSSFGPAVTTASIWTTRTHEWKPTGATWDTSYQYQVTPQDDAGNLGPTITGSALTPTVYQQTQSVTYAGTWGTSSSASYSSGSTRYSSTAGASASFKASGRSFGFVTTRASSRGKVKVYVDGVYKGTVTLTSSTTKYRNIAYVMSYATSGTHTIKLVVYSGRVDVDAFVVLR